MRFKKKFASVSQDLTLKLWDISDFLKSKPLQVAQLIKNSFRTTVCHEKEINCVKFSVDEELIATCS